MFFRLMSAMQGLQISIVCEWIESEIILRSLIELGYSFTNKIACPVKRDFWALQSPLTNQGSMFQLFDFLIPLVFCYEIQTKIKWIRLQEGSPNCASHFSAFSKKKNFNCAQFWDFLEELEYSVFAVISEDTVLLLE